MRNVIRKSERFINTMYRELNYSQSEIDSRLDEIKMKLLKQEPIDIRVKNSHMEHEWLGVIPTDVSDACFGKH